MLGKRGPQRGLFEADHLYVELVGRQSFYGFLAAHRGELFRDEGFAAFYKAGRGRPSVPPSLLATALVLQAYDRVSDEEARERAAFDLRWKVALGVAVEAQPFAKSTLQEFRAQLVLHEEQGKLFRDSLALARRQGWFRGRRLTVAVDTTYILGRGAVKDTYNLLADGIVQVVRALAAQEGEEVGACAGRLGLARYVAGGSLKGQAEVDWEDPEARRRFLSGIVADADRLLEVVRGVRGQLEPDSAADVGLREAAGLLARLLVQDIERRADGPALRQGVAEDRVVSVHDPEMRHGRKSSTKRFNGHKAQVAVDTDSQLITAVETLPGNAPDHAEAVAVVEATEAATGCAVETTVADCAYGDGPTRQAFAAAGRRLVAKVPTVTNRGCFPKTHFTLDLERGTCTCPAGQVTQDLRPRGRGKRLFRFAAALCHACPLRSQCVRGPHGRTVQVHPQEALLQQARAFQASPGFREYRARRQVVEHRLARLVQLGIRQARYFGRAKTLCQVFLAATVANLVRLAQAAGTPPSALSRVTALLLGLMTALWARRQGNLGLSRAAIAPLTLASFSSFSIPPWPTPGPQMVTSRPDF